MSGTPAAPPARGPERSAGQLTMLGLGVLGVSMAAPLIAAAGTVPALSMAMWRGGIASLLLAPYALTAGRTQLLALPRRDLALTCLAGVLLAAHFSLWITSLKLTSVAASTALVCMQAGWTVVLTRLRGAQVPRAVWLGLVIALLGVVVITGIDVGSGPRALLGDLLALAGGVFSAGYMVIGGDVRSSGTVSTTTYTFVCYASSAVVMLPVLAFTHTSAVRFGLRGWLVVIAVTLCSQILGHSVFNHLLATMSPTVVSLAILLEVPGASLIAGLFLRQAPPPAVYVGLVVILAGLAVVVRAQRPAPVPPPD